jgi:DNA-damage-inducible protein J
MSIRLLKRINVFKDLGTDTTTAIRIFLTQAVANNGFPFEIKRNIAEYYPYAAMTEEEILTKLEKSRKHGEEGKFREVDAAISDMRSRYGL